MSRPSRASLQEDTLFPLLHIYRELSKEEGCHGGAKLGFDWNQAHVFRFVVRACLKVLRASFRIAATSGQVCSSLTMPATRASCRGKSSG